MSERFPGKDLYPNLFKSIRVGNVKLKNRIIAAPTSPSMITIEGLFTPEMAAYLEEKALGFRPKTAQVDELCDCVDEYYVIGDCNKVAMIYQAMDAGYHAARRV